MISTKLKQNMLKAKKIIAHFVHQKQDFVINVDVLFSFFIKRNKNINILNLAQQKWNLLCLKLDFS